MPNLKSESEFQIVFVAGFSCRKDVPLSVMVMQWEKWDLFG